MLSSISPVGEAARRQPWTATVAAHLLGSAAAATALGAALGAIGLIALGGLSLPPRLAILAAVALAGVAVDGTVGLPTVHRQVDERWLTAYRGWVYGLGYGVQLGVGVVTIVPSSVVWATWVAALLTASPLAGAAVGVTFGVLRALPLALARPVTTVGRLRRLLARMERLRGPAARATAAGQLAVAGVALAVALW